MAGVGALLAVLRWSQADRVAAVVSCLAAVASVGVGVWAAFPASRTEPEPESGGDRGPAAPAGPAHGTVIRVADTGSAIAGRGGRASSGFSGPADRIRGEFGVERTGDADASEGGDADTGIRLD